MQLITDNASTLGSRFNLIFDPDAHKVYHHTVEKYPGISVSLNAAVELPDGRTFAFPFTSESPLLSNLEFFPTLTDLKYRGNIPELGIEATLNVRMPFYPRDIKLSTAPFCFIDISVDYMEGFNREKLPEDINPVTGKIVFSITTDDEDYESAECGFGYSISASSPEISRQGEGVPGKHIQTSFKCRGRSDFMVEEPNKLYVPFDLSKGANAELSLVWSAWNADKVLEFQGTSYDLKYNQYFKSDWEMSQWAIDNYEDIVKKCTFFDNLFRDWSLGSATSHFTAQAFHSYIANTWWVRQEDGSDWFSVWEGNRYYHSPIDVEYNCALFYLNIWPELLDMLLKEWAGAAVNSEAKGEDGGSSAFLSRDIGIHHFLGRSCYPYDMEVEGNSNFLLLMAARTFFSGDMQFFLKYHPLCKKLANFIINSDVKGNGFPDKGIANHLDDAGPALQFAKSQTYLAVKSQAALWALGEMEELIAEKKLGKGTPERWKAFAAKGVKTLSEEAWIKDHYSVCLERTTQNMIDPWSGDSLQEGDLDGWDDYSIYTTNGLLYLFMTNMKMPRWNQVRLLRDINSSDQATKRDYGNAHTSSGGRNVWFSENLWRDYTAAYYGLDYLCKIEDYRDFQLLNNCKAGTELYRDSITNTERSFGPQGITALGASQAAAGMRINRIENELYLSPIRNSLKVPLLPMADWENIRIPWIQAETSEGVKTVRITDKDLIGDIKVHCIGCELEEA